MAICCPQGTQVRPKWNESDTQVTSKWQPNDTQVKPKWHPSDVQVRFKLHSSDTKVTPKFTLAPTLGPWGATLTQGASDCYQVWSSQYYEHSFH